MSEATGGAILTAGYRVIPVGVSQCACSAHVASTRHLGASLQQGRAVWFGWSVY
jgi:hypothetical protein